VTEGSLRILQTVDAVGGVWQYGLDLARGLAVRGTETVVVVLGPAATTPQRAEALTIPGVTLVESGLPLDWLCDGATPVLAAAEAIADMARAVRADLIQLNTPTLAAGIPAEVPVVAVTHGCVSTWWQAARRGKPLDPAYFWHRQLMGEGLRAADRIVAPTASYAAVVARYYSLPRVPQVVHNGRTPVAAHAKAFRDRVLTVGRLWDPVKGAELLDGVAARLKVPFHAAGATTGPHGEGIDLQHLHLLGQLYDAALGRHLAARPIFVSAALFEPFGLAVLEAANAGCALVLSDIASFRELWDGAALFVPARDADAYTGAISALLHDSETRLRLGTAASRRASRFNPQRMAEGMLAIYSDVLGRPLSRGRVAA
jgi:glycosyltransferase involved in cell wall biosynthesis